MVHPSIGSFLVKVFACILGPPGSQIDDDVRRQTGLVARQRDLSTRWHAFDGLRAFVASDDATHDSLIVVRGSHVAIGDVTLQNRPDVEEWLGFPASELTDLEAVLWLATTLCILASAPSSRRRGSLSTVDISTAGDTGPPMTYRAGPRLPRPSKTQHKLAAPCSPGR